MYQSVATITQLTQLQHKTHLAKDKQSKIHQSEHKKTFFSWFGEGES